MGKSCKESIPRHTQLVKEQINSFSKQFVMQYKLESQQEVIQCIGLMFNMNIKITFLKYATAE